MRKSRLERHEIAKRRIVNVLRAHGVATARILEQKISDAGPLNQRTDPHILTTARNELAGRGIVRAEKIGNVNWYFLKETEQATVQERIAELNGIHERTLRKDFTLRVGQALEIAVYKALEQQTELHYLGSFPDLCAHGDETLYRKEEPPSTISGRTTGERKLDFIVIGKTGEVAGMEAKNIREWLYPDREEVTSLIGKCCALNAIPVLVGRRIPYATFSVLNPCGVIIHQTYNQLYPAADVELAAKVRDKRLLGYHDVRTGNEPDARLEKFIGTNLPRLLESARGGFSEYFDLLERYGSGKMGYKEFAGRVKRRMRREAEDGEEEGGPEDLHED